MLLFCFTCCKIEGPEPQNVDILLHLLQNRRSRTSKCYYFVSLVAKQKVQNLKMLLFCFTCCKTDDPEPKDVDRNQILYLQPASQPASQPSSQPASQPDQPDQPTQPTSPLAHLPALANLSTGGGVVSYPRFWQNYPPFL